MPTKILTLVGAITALTFLSFSPVNADYPPGNPGCQTATVELPQRVLHKRLPDWAPQMSLGTFDVPETFQNRTGVMVTYQRHNEVNPSVNLGNNILLTSEGTTITALDVERPDADLPTDLPFIPFDGLITTGATFDADIVFGPLGRYSAGGSIMLTFCETVPVPSTTVPATTVPGPTTTVPGPTTTIAPQPTLPPGIEVPCIGLGWPYEICSPVEVPGTPVGTPPPITVPDEGLPETGAETLGLVFVGATILFGGFVLILVARRRVPS